MPTAPPRTCKRGCGKLEPCPTHHVTGYRDTKTDEERRFYNSALWQRIRAAHRKAEPFCRECMAHGVFRLGDMTDHIVSIRNGGSRTNDANLQTLCNPHHNRKRQSERGGDV